MYKQNVKKKTAFKVNCTITLDRSSKKAKNLRNTLSKMTPLTNLSKIMRILGEFNK